MSPPTTTTTAAFDIETLLRKTAAELRRSSDLSVRAIHAALAPFATQDDRTQARAAKTLTTIDLEDLIRRARASVKEPPDARLTDFEVRCVVQVFHRLKPDELHKLLDAHPRCWAGWVQCFFAARLDLPPEEERNWVDLLGHAPREVRLLDGTLDYRALLHAGALDSAKRLAKTLGATVPLAIALRGLTAPDANGTERLLKSSWKYTAVVLAELARGTSRSPQELWREVKSDPKLESLLLPRRIGTDSSRFAPAVKLSSAADCAEAHARFALALTVSKGLHDETLQTAWRTVFFEHRSFGDPRTFLDPRDRPEFGWKIVGALDRKSYDALLDSLFREDITLFFSAVEIDEDRKQFWLRYASRASSSRFYLSRAVRLSLQGQFFSSATHAKNALARVRPLSDSGLAAFVLHLRANRTTRTGGANGAIIVEFSRTGNAAWFYDAASTAWDEASFASAKDFRFGDWAINRWPHVPQPGWQWKFEQELATYGVTPD